MKKYTPLFVLVLIITIVNPLKTEAIDLFDLNGDGIINIMDLEIIATNYGSTNNNVTDINADGLTDLYDLVIAAKKMFRTNINSKEELQSYLIENYSELETSIGKTTFDFKVYKNTSITFGFDYLIQVWYDPQFFYYVKYNIELSSVQREKVKQEIKNYQEKLAKDIIRIMPDKKLYGGYLYYYSSSHTYRRYYSWLNFDGDPITDYEETKPSEFRWYDFIDDDF